MQEVNINTLVGKYNYLNENIPNDIIILGKITSLYINHNYEKLDLSKVECNEIIYEDQKGGSIKNHILPDSLIRLYCSHNKLTSLPDLPDSLQILHCYDNQLTSLPDLPDSLQILHCYDNKLTSFANAQLPNSLQILCCYDNELTLIPKLPNSLEFLNCDNNQLTLLPDLPYSLKDLLCNNNELILFPNISHIDHELTLSFIQDLPIGYIPYNTNLKLFKSNNEINIIDYPHNPITNQKGLDEYMDYIKNHQLNRIKSARK